MNGNEIIKALEAILNREYREDTVPTAVATIEFFKCVYNFINHQKAEIESLKIANEKMYQACKEQESEIERLEDLLDSAITSEADCVSNIPYERAEAIKEYENKILELFPCDKIFTTISRFDVKDIAKEMTEEK